jgi:cell division protein FtsL
MAANHKTSVAGVVPAGAGQEEKTTPQLKYSVFLFVAFVLMAVAITYVWSHVQMTKLEYQVAEEMRSREQMLEEQRKLKLEYATLKSPQRIEAIAKSSLNLSYPDGDQVIIIRDAGAVK